MTKYNNLFKGVNKLCKRCIKGCKQYGNVLVVICPMYTSKKRKERLECNSGDKNY